MHFESLLPQTGPLLQISESPRLLYVFPTPRPGSFCGLFWCVLQVRTAGALRLERG